ncbi:MAG: serine hydrolase [Arenimonas sp.]
MSVIDPQRRLLCTAIAAGGIMSAIPTWAKLNFAKNDFSWSRIFENLSESQRGLLLDPTREIQILYTQIDRDSEGGIKLEHHAFHHAPKRWFFPASTIKLPIALLACEEVARVGGNLESAIMLRQSPETGIWADAEPLSESLRRSLCRTFTVSDNIPYNRFYELLGPDKIHARLKALGCPNTRAITRLGSRDTEANRRTGSVQIIDVDGKPLAGIAPRVAKKRGFPFGKALKGEGFVGDDGVLIPGEHDFSFGNFMPLADLHQMLVAFICPQAVLASQRWKIPGEWREDILKEMGRFPRESTEPVYPAPEYYDAYAKFFVLGGNKQDAPEGFRSYGKTGEAYGYLSDSSYLVDQGTGSECFLSTVIHCNPDGIYNDDKYDYEEIGLPFLAALGKSVLAFEASRKNSLRLNVPSGFK